MVGADVSSTGENAVIVVFGGERIKMTVEQHVYVVCQDAQNVIYSRLRFYFLVFVFVFCAFRKSFLL